MTKHRRLTHTALLASGVAGVAAAAALVAGCGGQSSTASQPAGGSNTAVVQTAAGPGGQRVLVDSQGHTLYAADQESAHHIMCVGGCVQFWFPVTAQGGSPPVKGVPAGQIGTVQRPDGGGTQVTFDGKPLYTFKLDTSAGTTKGDGFSDQFGGTSFHWHAVTVNGVQGTSGGSGQAQGGGSYGSSSGGQGGGGYGSSSGGQGGGGYGY